MKKISLLSLALLLVISASAQQWVNNGTHIYNTNSGNVGIGVPNPTFPLDVDGMIHTRSLFVSDPQDPSGLAAWFRAATNSNSNVVIQGGAGNYQAYWLTATNGLFKIGGNGGQEPAVGAINITSSGNVGIGITNPGTFKLAVEGKIGAREVKVTTANPWPDYVFSDDYTRRSLNDLEYYIRKEKHLPGIPSAIEISSAGGFELGEMNRKLLEKIEELTLYVIELKKENDTMKKDILELKKNK